MLRPKLLLHGLISITISWHCPFKTVSPAFRSAKQHKITVLYIVKIFQKLSTTLLETSFIYVARVMILRNLIFNAGQFSTRHIQWMMIENLFLLFLSAQDCLPHSIQLIMWQRRWTSVVSFTVAEPHHFYEATAAQSKTFIRPWPRVRPY
jgi:hypothetical protein